MVDGNADSASLDMSCQGFYRLPDNPTYGVPCNVTLVASSPSPFGNILSKTISFVPSGQMDLKMRKSCGARQNALQSAADFISLLC